MQALDPRLVIAVIAGLSFFAMFIDTLIRSRAWRWYTGVLVACYVILSLCGLALIDWPAAVLALGVMAPGGIYLLARDFQRNNQAQADAQQAALKAAVEGSNGHSSDAPTA